MSKRAEEKALEAYPVKMVSGPIGYEDHRFDLHGLPRLYFVEGYEKAEKDLIAIIESRIAEILGDAQPKPTIRIELKELITRIKEAKK